LVSHAAQSKAVGVKRWKGRKLTDTATPIQDKQTIVNISTLEWKRERKRYKRCDIDRLSIEIELFDRTVPKLERHLHGELRRESETRIDTGRSCRP
jgi:hypothetical protein